MKKDVRIKISLVINILIFILVFFSTVIMFTGYKFMHGSEVVLESTKFGVFKYFTVQSNLFVGIVCLIFAIKEIELLNGKINNIDKKYYIWKLVSTSAVGLTFFVVFTYLRSIVEGGIMPLLMNSSLFFHCIIPILSIICFIFLEKTRDIKFKEVFYGLIPVGLYALYYMTNVFLHMENGKVSPKYDWYWFVYYGVWTTVIVVPVILLIAYLINLLLWYLNRKELSR